MHQWHLYVVLCAGKYLFQVLLLVFTQHLIWTNLECLVHVCRVLLSVKYLRSSWGHLVYFQLQFCITILMDMFQVEVNKTPMGLDALLETQLGHLPKFHIYSLSTSGGQNWAYFCSTGRGFRITGRFSKLPYLGMKLGHWPKWQKLHIYFVKYPLSPKYHSVLLCGCPFSRYWQFCIFPWATMLNFNLF